MGSRTVPLFLLVLSITALCSADVPQDQLTWRVVHNHARVSVRTADDEMSGDGVGSGSGCGGALPARSLDQLQLHAMCELSCISETVSILHYGL